MSTDPLLQLLRANARYTHEQLAELLSMSADEVSKRISELEKDGIIMGYNAVINPESFGDQHVSAFIEVKLTPERGGGFDRNGAVGPAKVPDCRPRTPNRSDGYGATRCAQAFSR